MSVNIFDYMDIRQFLSDFYREQKKEDPDFSYRRWTEQLGLNNRTLLRLILQGKRSISCKTKAQFKEFFKLDSLSSEYFDTLIDYSQAPTSSQKQAMGLRLIQLQRKNFIQPEVSPDLAVLADVYGPLILTLISSSGFALSEKDISEKLKLKKERLTPILSRFSQVGLLYENKGRYTAVHSTFKIADHFGHKGLSNFYSHWFKESVNAIALPFEVRRFRSLQLVLSKQEFEDLNQKFQEFVLSNLSRYEKNTLEKRRVYLLNSALFPVTDTL